MVHTIKVGQSEPKTFTLYTKGELAGLATVDFSTMDAWFEEEEQIFVHPKDPYKVWIYFFFCIKHLPHSHFYAE